MYCLSSISKYDMANFQHYLEEKAQKGWFLRAVGFIGLYFTKGEPKNIRYRLEPIDSHHPSLDQEQLDYYASCGWQFVWDVEELYHIFRTDDPSAPELHTDPVVEGTAMDDMVRRNNWYFLSIVIALLLVIFRGLYEGWSYAIGSLFPIAVVVEYTWYAYRRKTLRKQLKAGIRPAFDPKAYHRSKLLHWILPIVEFLLFILWGFMLFRPYFNAV